MANYNIKNLKLKQLSRGVLRKRCSEHIQQTCNRTPMSKCDFNKVAKATSLKSHFGMDVLLYICWIFSEHLFPRILLDGCFSLKFLKQTFEVSIKIFCRKWEGENLPKWFFIYKQLEKCQIEYYSDNLNLKRFCRRTSLHVFMLPISLLKKESVII